MHYIWLHRLEALLQSSDNRIFWHYARSKIFFFIHPTHSLIPIAVEPPLTVVTAANSLEMALSLPISPCVQWLALPFRSSLILFIIIYDKNKQTLSITPPLINASLSLHSTHITTTIYLKGYLTAYIYYMMGVYLFSLS